MIVDLQTLKRSHRHLIVSGCHSAYLPMMSFLEIVRRFHSISLGFIETRRLQPFDLL